MRHADDKHRAASDPSEGHTVKTGEREVGALLIDDGEVHLAVSCLGFSFNHLDEIRIGTRSRSAARVDHSRIVCRKRSASNGERDAITVGVVISRRRLDLRKDVSTLIKTDNVNLAVCVGRQFGLLAILRLGAIRLDIATIIALLLQRELNAREPLIVIIGAHLGDIDAIGVVISRVLNRGSRSTLIMWVVGIGQHNLIYLGFTNHILELFFDLALIKDLARVELSLVFDSHLRVAVQQDSSVALTLATLEIGEADSQRTVIVSGIVAILNLGTTDLDRDIGRRAVILKLGRHGFGKRIREGVRVGAVGVDITRNRTGEFIIDPIVHS